jgi:hypothetical protein
MRDVVTIRRSSRRFIAGAGMRMRVKMIVYNARLDRRKVSVLTVSADDAVVVDEVRVEIVEGRSDFPVDVIVTSGIDRV